MISKIKDNDEIILLPNITKDGKIGDTIIEIWCLYYNNKFIFDCNDFIKNLYLERSGIKYRFCKKYFANVLLNGKYTTISFGFGLYKKFMSENMSVRPKTLKIVINYESIQKFPNYSDSYFMDKRINFDITTEFLKTKTFYVEDMLKSKNWKNNLNEISKILKEHNIVSEHKEYLKQIRKHKLERIL